MSKSNLVFYVLVIFISFLNLVTCPGAFNIYANPDLTKTSGKFDGFMIDFKGVKTPSKTYWSLCSFDMDLTDFKKKHPDAEGGGGYGGFQTQIDEHVGILSFWEIKYTENGRSQKQRATRVYPEGAESSFGSEGEGNHWISEFGWETNNWYRYLLRSWEDEKTGNTFVGEWFQDLTTGKWTLFSYFDMHLQRSYLKGGMGMFQENFNAKYGEYERKFYIKNTYVHDRTEHLWISIPTYEMSYNLPSWGYGSTGTHEFGATDEYFWGSSGVPVENQDTYEANTPDSKTLTISQPEEPDINGGRTKITYFNVKTEKNKAVFTWEINEYESPMLSYTISIIDSEEKVIHSYRSTRPEERSYTYTGTLSGEYEFRLELESVFQNSHVQIVTKTV